MYWHIFYYTQNQRYMGYLIRLCSKLFLLLGKILWWNIKLEIAKTYTIQDLSNICIICNQRERERGGEKGSDREREREVGVTWALTEPCSLSCSFLRSGRDRLTTSLMSTTLLCISSMATSIGCRTESVFFTTSILFFMYGKLWEAAKSKTLAYQGFYSLSVYQTFNSQHRYGIRVILSLCNFFNLAECYQFSWARIS